MMFYYPPIVAHHRHRVIKPSRLKPVAHQVGSKIRQGWAWTVAAALLLFRSACVIIFLAQTQVGLQRNRFDRWLRFRMLWWRYTYVYGAPLPRERFYNQPQPRFGFADLRGAFGNPPSHRLRLRERSLSKTAGYQPITIVGETT